MAKKKPVWRWIGEAALVFASVLGAFMVEDYRHNKQEKGDYVNALLAFRNDVHEDVRDYRFSYDTAAVIMNKFHRSPGLPGLLQVLKRVDSLLNTTVDDNMLAWEAFDDVYGFSDWRNASSFYEQLNRYSEFLIADSLHRIVRQYQTINNGEFVPYETYNEILDQFYNYAFGKININDPGDQINTEVANSLYFKNSVIVLRSIIEGNLIPVEQLQSRRLSEMVRRIDKVLHHHDIDTSSLDKKFLISEN